MRRMRTVELLPVLAVGALFGTGCASVADSSRLERTSSVESVSSTQEVRSGSALRFEQAWLAQEVTYPAIRASAPLGTQSQVPLTTPRLRVIANAQGIGAGLTGVSFSRAVGLVFEHWILSALAIPRNSRSFFSPARAGFTGGLPASVIPDAVLPVVWVKWGFMLMPFSDSLLCEVKAVRGPLTLSLSRHQIRGLIRRHRNWDRCHC